MLMRWVSTAGLALSKTKSSL
uniref:Uncharacterized protein n=1 Tax=Arundo donax TaxID=35708 RepID=A0A0A9AMS2_ARUDO